MANKTTTVAHTAQDLLVDLTVLEELAEPAPLDKLVSEELVSVTETVPPNNAVLTLVEMTVVNVFLDKPVSTTSVLDFVPPNVPELSTVLPRPAVGTDAEETVEAAHLDTDARMESVCAILNALHETVDLTVVEELAVLVPLMQFVTTTLLMPSTELATRSATDVVTELVLQLRPQPLSEHLNSTKLTVPKIVVPSLELFLWLLDKRIN